MVGPAALGGGHGEPGGVQACTLFLGWLGVGIVHASGPLVLTDGEQPPLGEAADKGNLQECQREEVGRRRLADTCQRKARAAAGLFTLGRAARVVHHPGKAVSSEARGPAPLHRRPLAEPPTARGALGRRWGPVPGCGDLAEAPAALMPSLNGGNGCRGASSLPGGLFGSSAPPQGPSSPHSLQPV